MGVTQAPHGRSGSLVVFLGRDRLPLLAVGLLAALVAVSRWGNSLAASDTTVACYVAENHKGEESKVTDQLWS